MTYCAATDDRAGRGQYKGKSGWFVFYPGDSPNVAHVLPNFGRQHDTQNAGLMCWCCPRYEWLKDGGVLAIHECDN